MGFKTWQTLFAEFGLNRITDTCYVGQVEGYYTIFRFEQNIRTLKWFIGINPTERTTTELTQLTDQLSNLEEVEAAGIIDATVVITTKLPKRMDEAEYTLRQISQVAYPFLKANHYETGCFMNGINDGTVKLTQFDDKFAYYSEAGYQQAITELEGKKTEYDERPHNLLLGLIGAIPGILLGSFLWGLISYLGYYAWWAASIGGIAAPYGYRKLGGKITILGAVLIELLLVAGAIAANIIEYAVHFYNELKYAYDVTFLEVLKETPSIIIEEPSIRDVFLKDLFIGVFIGAVVGTFAIVNMYKEDRGSYTAKRFED
ncbi:hypothetical protein NHG28_04490 [Aerococcaceae bacterium NML201209]|nr:hypothetical protein [Aerococcaceae bacterium NML201209]